MEMTPSQRKERFMEAWANAQVLLKMRDLELAFLLSQMALQVEAHADMSNDEVFGANELTPEGAFNVATECLEDIISKENLKWYFNNFAEEMKAFGTKRVVKFEPKLPG